MITPDAYAVSMTEEAATEPTDTEIQEYRDRRAIARPDGMLSTLLDVADEMDDFVMSLTVTVPGGVVSGSVINHRTWLDLVIADGGSWGALVTPFKATEDERLKAVAGEVGDEPMPTYLQFIHMRDARFVSGGLFPTSQVGMLWRGRLSEVSSWAIGSLRGSETS
jgi:hypothetical protein